MLAADSIGSTTNIIVIGFEIIPVLFAVQTGNGIEKYVVMDMVMVKMGGYHNLVFALQELLGKFHTYGMSLFRGHFTGGIGMYQVIPQYTAPL